MSLFQSSMAIIYVVLFILSECSFTFAAHIEITGLTSVTKDNILLIVLIELAAKDDTDGGQQKTRVKRNGAGKFADAASMSGMKILQLALTMVKNLFAEETIGGKHPMSRSVPGPVVHLLKEAIMPNLFPDLSKDH